MELLDHGTKTRFELLKGKEFAEIAKVVDSIGQIVNALMRPKISQASA